MAQTPIPFALHPTVGHATPIHKRSRRPNFDSASMTKPSFNLFGRQNHYFLGFGGFRGVSVGFFVVAGRRALLSPVKLSNLNG
jgi:hypothetical protein